MSIAIELYGAPTGNCFRAAIALEEAGLAYAVKLVDLRSAAHHRPEFLTLNPAGKVPVLVDRRGSETIVIAQSNAILAHLAAGTPQRLSPAGTTLEWARYHERLYYFITEVIGPSHEAFQLSRSGCKDGVDVLAARSLAHLQASERFLDGGLYMAGESFSLVDILAATITLSLKASLDWSGLPRLHDWFERISSRPAFTKGMNAFTLR